MKLLKFKIYFVPLKFERICKLDFFIKKKNVARNFFFFFFFLCSVSKKFDTVFDNKDNVINVISKLSRSTDKTINCKMKTNEMLIIIIG